MTVSHKAGDILDGDNFDRLIAGKFPPMRRRSDVRDFEPTIAVDYHASCSGECDQGRRKCRTPDACRLPEDSEFGALEGLARGSGWIALSWLAVALCAGLAWLAWGMLP